MAKALVIKTEFVGLPCIEGWRLGVHADSIESA
jgi:hypothetical protein